ncbi:MAG: hypothetical protein U0638_02155 [Phycisphaerales bacterium]
MSVGEAELRRFLAKVIGPLTATSKQRSLAATGFNRTGAFRAQT